MLESNCLNEIWDDGNLIVLIVLIVIIAVLIRIRIRILISAFIFLANAVTVIVWLDNLGARNLR